MNSEMLYCIPKDKHDIESLKDILAKHPEVAFVSLVAIDINGNHTDVKIPMQLFLEDIEGMLKTGVQTDGSSVQLPLIADITDAKVTLVPDTSVNWYVDHNADNYAEFGDAYLPIGTLRIPATLFHNEVREVGSRVILRKAMEAFKKAIPEIIKEHPYMIEYLPVSSADDIAEILLTSATEMEFYVKTPHEVADKERLHTSQELKEQYWKRTVGPVRTALEQTLLLLDNYGFGVEMGHKEVGGVKPELGAGGDYTHIMEQLEIDWKYAEPMQAADNDRTIRYFIKDVFRQFGLDVTFMAKPVEGVAGSGKHTHLGAAAKLANGKVVSLFAAKDPSKDYLSPLGFGALLGLLKNYEVINPIANPTSDALNRLKPGFEAPISIVTSLGPDVHTPSRNRTVLACVIRDPAKPLATRFELRSPNPKSNTHLVLAACIMAMLDGIKAVAKAEKTPAQLLESISKKAGDEDFYLETGRVYRTEGNIFEDFTAEERDRLFGKTPATAWENINALDSFPEKIAVLCAGDVFTDLDIKSFKAASLANWERELHDRVINELRDRVKKCRKIHDPADCDKLDVARFEAIKASAQLICKDTEKRDSLLTELSKALEAKDYRKASSLELEAFARVQQLEAMYSEYCRNIL